MLNWGELRATIEGLFRPGERAVVGVSGGPDSVALLHLLIDFNRETGAGLRLHVAHLNHQLRGAESDGDAAFVVQVCDRLGIEHSVATRDVAAIARDQGQSLEDAGRRERYALFHRVCLRVGAGLVALGHQADDNAETILHRIVRGTGLRGLSGIPQVRPLSPDESILVVRPLLQVNRHSIMAYLGERGIAYRMDVTNQTVEPTRNRIRHEVIPILQTINPRTHDAILRLARQAGWVEDHLHELAARVFPTVVVNRDDGALTLDVDVLRSKSRALQVALFRFAVRMFRVGERDVSLEHVDAFLRLLQGEEGSRRHDLPGGLCIRKEYSRLVFFLCAAEAGRGHDADPGESPLDASCPVLLEGTTNSGALGVEVACHSFDLADDVRVDPAAFARSQRALGKDGVRIETIDADCVQPPLILRRWHAGDRFTPLGAPAAKTVSEFLIDAKVERSRRERLVILADRVGPLWLIGLRIDDRVKCTKTTKRVLQVRARMFVTE